MLVDRPLPHLRDISLAVKRLVSGEMFVRDEHETALLVVSYQSSSDAVFLASERIVVSAGAPPTRPPCNATLRIRGLPTLLLTSDPHWTLPSGSPAFLGTFSYFAFM